MIVYLDNDALLKLVAWNLLDDALAILHAKREDVRILRSAEYSLRTKRRDPRYGGEATFQRLERVMTDFIRIDEEPDGYGALVAIDGIDPGEGLLIGHTAASTAAYLTTGDKRCLRALANSDLQDICSRLAGRVICVETAIKSLIHSLGFEYVRDSVLPVLGCDTAIRVAFGSGKLTTPQSALDALDSYITELPAGLLYQS